MAVPIATLIPADPGRYVSAPVEAEIAALYETYQRPMFRFICHQLGPRRASHDIAADLTQLTFIRLWHAMQRGARFQTPAQARSFLHTIATNLLRDQWRSDHQRAEVPLVPVEGDADECAAFGALAPCIPQAADGDALWETLLVVEQVLATLPPEKREVLLAHACGYRHDEQAARLGISVSGVKNRIARARTTLRERYDAEVEVGASGQTSRCHVP
jgi:RNA polymerase sigma factor (sigma-70 family)